MTGTPNAVLRALVHASGLSLSELAWRTNERARTRYGFASGVTKGRISWWLSRGERPQVREVRAAFLDILSTTAGFRVTPAMAGWEGGTWLTGGLDLPDVEHATLAAVGDVTRGDLLMALTRPHLTDPHLAGPISRRDAMHDAAGIAAGSLLVDPLQRALTTTPARLDAPADGRRVTSADLAAIEQLTATFRERDNRFGGGLYREAVVGLLARANDLVGHARYDAATGIRLRQATAELCGLAGWMSFDAGRHRFAQRYWTLGVRHAHAAEDHDLAAYLLYEMSEQMLDLDRPEDALELMLMAHHGTQDIHNPRLHALICAVEAHAYAQLGQSEDAWAAMTRCENEFAAPSDMPVPDRLAFATESALVISGRADVLRLLATRQSGARRKAMLKDSLDATQASLTDLQEGYVRTRVRRRVEAVDTYELAGEYDEAAAIAGQAADAIGSVDSPRTLEWIQRIRSRLGLEPADPRVRALAAQLDRSLRPGPQAA